MGLCIELADEAGAVLEIVADDGNILHRLLPREDDDSSPMLASIDWYGDTTFNRVQMRRFLAEWDQMVERAATQEKQSFWAAVRKLAERCQNEVHLYLKFIGD